MIGNVKIHIPHAIGSIGVDDLPRIAEFGVNAFTFQDLGDHQSLRVARQSS
jgi:hypothetical protein